MRIQRTLIIVWLMACALRANAVPVPMLDGDMESEGRAAWKTYGTPVVVEKVLSPHSGKQSLRVVADNKDVMGGGFEGIQRKLGAYKTGDRIRVSFWLRPQAGQEVWVGMGRTSFEQVWRFVDTDWMQAICDFRVRADGEHSIWIMQHDVPNSWLIDDFTAEKIQRLELGTAPVADRVAIENPTARLWFDRKSGALCGLENKSTKEVLSSLGARQPLFALEIQNSAAPATDTFDFSSATLQSLRGGKNELSLEYKLNELPVRIACNIKSTSAGEFVFTATIDNQSNRKILGFTYPLLQGATPPTSDPKNLTLVHPYLCGQIERDALKSAGTDWGYPGRAVMGWFDLSGERGGIALATHDKTRTGTRLTALPAVESTFDLSLTKEIVVAPRMRWQSPEHVVFIHDGDWHVAADAYRTWARSWLGKPDVPRWIQDADGWMLIGIQNGVPFWQIIDRYRSAEWMGLNFLHIQGEGTDNQVFDAEGKRVPHDTSFYYPSPRFGTPQELKQAVSDIHARDGRAMFYFLYDRWTPSIATDEMIGAVPRVQVPQKFFPPPNFYENNALVERIGAQPPTENPYMAVRMMCLAAPGWQEWMRFWAIDYYAKEIGADGFYWDVMGRNGPFRCFNARHNHEGQNDWARGSAEVLERVIREGRKINPDYSSAIEGAQDALLPWVGFHLMSGATKTPEVLRYTFPELCLVDGFANHYWKWTQPEKARRVWLNGERFDLQGYHAQVRKYIWLRKRLKPFIDWPARFVDTVGLTASDAAVEAKRFVRDDGQNRAVLVTMMNESGKDKVLLTVQLAPLRLIKIAHSFTPDGAIRPLEIVEQKNGAVSFYAPPTEISGALFVEAVESSLQVVPTLEQIMTPGEDGVELTLFYPTGKPQNVNVTLSGAALRPMTERKSDSDFVERRRWAPQNGIAALQGWEKVDANVLWDTLQASEWSLICPPLVNGDFERLRAGGQLDYWPALPSSENPASGTYCLKLESGDDKAPVMATVLTPLKPSTRYRFSAKVRRDVDKSDARAAVVEYEDLTKLRVSASLGSGGEAGEWQEFSTEFTSHPDPRSSAVYLYLGKSKTAWFDDLKLEEVR